MTQVPDVSQERTSFSRGLSATLVVCGGGMWAIPMAIVLVIAPRFEEIFRKFQMPGGVSELTAGIIGLAHFLTEYGYVLLPAGVAAVGVLAWLCSLRSWRGGIVAAGLFAGLSLLALPGIIVVLVVGLFQPLTALISAVGGGAAGGGAGGGPG